MDDYIKRKDAIEALGEEPYVWSDTDVEIAEHAQWVSDVKAIEAVPSADVVARDCYDRLLAENDELRKVRPMVRGKWKHGVCQICFFDWSEVAPFANVPNFCPNCGARMVKDDD